MLTQHGWYFQPEYVKYGQAEEERNSGQKPYLTTHILQVQPNPASDYVLFTLQEDTVKDAVLRLFDSNGRLVGVFTGLQPGTAFVWKTGDAVSGIYYYHFISEGKTVRGKILLNK